MIAIMDQANDNLPKIMVIGIGGAGNNAIDRMIDAEIDNVTFVAVNTDLQVLESSKASTHIQIGKKLTGGYGAGADPAIGEASAIENEEEISAHLEAIDMAILTCGMGGGTGTGAIPVIAKMCKDRGILTIAVVTTPFSFEGSSRPEASAKGLSELKKYVDTLIVIPNDKLLSITDKVFYLDDAFKMADSVLKYVISGITNIIFNKGIINLDFNDIKTTLVDKGTGHLGIGTVPKDGSIIDAVEQAINSPLLDTSIKGASNILINSSGKINLLELNQALNVVRELAGPKVNLIWGTVNSPSDEENIVVTLIATGMSNKPVEKNDCNTETHNVAYTSPSLLGKKRIDVISPALEEMNIPPFLQKYESK